MIYNSYSSRLSGISGHYERQVILERLSPAELTLILQNRTTQEIRRLASVALQTGNQAIHSICLADFISSFDQSVGVEDETVTPLQLNATFPKLLARDNAQHKTEGPQFFDLTGCCDEVQG